MLISADFAKALYLVSFSIWDLFALWVDMENHLFSFAFRAFRRDCVQLVFGVGSGGVFWNNCSITIVLLLFRLSRVITSGWDLYPFYSASSKNSKVTPLSASSPPALFWLNLRVPSLNILHKSQVFLSQLFYWMGNVMFLTYYVGDKNILLLSIQTT